METMAAVAQTRLFMEEDYGKNNDSYTLAHGCFSGIFATDPNLSGAIASLGTTTEKGASCFAQNMTYAVSAPLTSTSSSFCVDSTGYTGNGVAVDKDGAAECQVATSTTP